MFLSIPLKRWVMQTGVEAMPAMLRSTEATVGIESAPETLFAYLDDHRHLGAHMSESSWMMLGSKMDYEFDAAEARSVGSRFGFHGKMLGISLSVEQVVAIRTPSQIEGLGNHRGAKSLGHRPLSHGLRNSPHGWSLTAAGLHRLRPAGSRRRRVGSA